MISSCLVPNFLEASTPSELVLLCTKLNIATGKYITYTFLHDGKNFFAFFYWEAFETLPNIKGEENVIE